MITDEEWERALVGLDEEQRVAVEWELFEPLLIVAGPGSGKTHTATHRVVHLVRSGADPSRILAVTFTNKAAGEMKGRIIALLGKDIAAKIWVVTFHSLGVRLLARWGRHVGRSSDFSIYADKAHKEMLRLAMNSVLGIRDSEEDVDDEDDGDDPDQESGDERKPKVKPYAEAIDRRRNKYIGLREYEVEGGDPYRFREVWIEYERRMTAANAVDFGHLLTMPVDLCESIHAAHELRALFDHVLVDELQDTSLVQYKLVQFLSGRTRSFTAVGDDDQSIYGFRGADVANILAFAEGSPRHVVRLVKNHRSTPSIVALCRGVIEHNTHRIEKNLRSANEKDGAGALPVVRRFDDENREAQYVADVIEKRMKEEGALYADHAVLYRTNDQSKPFEAVFKKRGIPCRVIGGITFFETAEVKAAMSYLVAAHNANDDQAVERAISSPPRGIGEATVENFYGLGAARGVRLLAAMRMRVADPSCLRMAAPAQKALVDIVTLIDSLARDASAGVVPSVLIRRVLDDSGYVVHLEKHVAAAEAKVEAAKAKFKRKGGSKAERELDKAKKELAKAVARAANMNELIITSETYESREGAASSLDGFLHESMLASAEDTGAPVDFVPLMSIHKSKGLQFRTVFVTGIEEGIFPNSKAVTEKDLEEERRMLYVAASRPRTTVHLTWAACRSRWGEVVHGGPSRFLRELEAKGLISIERSRPPLARSELPRSPWDMWLPPKR